MTNRNVQFLSVIDSDAKNAILESIAVHIGITPQEAFAEVAGDEAEHLLDYMPEPQRGATLVLMQRRGMWP
jgi:hypothetical protein